MLKTRQAVVVLGEMFSVFSSEKKIAETFLFKHFNSEECFNVYLLRYAGTIIAHLIFSLSGFYMAKYPQLITNLKLQNSPKR